VNVTVTGVARDEGTVVLFHAEEVDGNPITIGVDHRLAQGLVDGLEVHGEVHAAVEPWQIVARSSVRHESNRSTLG